jgi:dTDP-4-dehydrorhamnose reductase
METICFDFPEASYKLTQKMRILLLGKYGQVGWELQRTLSSLGEVLAYDYPEFDMTSADSICQIVRETQPEVIVNATAYNQVDQAEQKPEIAFKINGVGPGILAEEAQRISAGLIHYSTDYVFDGHKGEPYSEDDEPNPINIYGKSKLAGEEAVHDVGGSYLIFRTSWVYSLRRECFVTKVLRWAHEQQTLRIVTDQTSNPTWCRVLAEVTAQVLAKGGERLIPWIEEHRGLYHLACRGTASRYEWAQEILSLDPEKENQSVKKINPAKSSEFPTPAQRPTYTALNIQKFCETFGLTPPHWKQALRLAMGNSAGDHRAFQI